MPTTRGILASFFVDMDELANVVSFDPANHSASRTVHPTEAVHVVSDHAMDRRCRDVDDAREPGWSEFSALAECHDRRSMCAGVTRAIPETEFALLTEASPPFVRAVTGDIHRLRGSSDGPSRRNPFAEPTAPFSGERSITVHFQPPVWPCVV